MGLGLGAHVWRGDLRVRRQKEGDLRDVEEVADVEEVDEVVVVVVPGSTWSKPRSSGRSGSSRRRGSSHSRRRGSSHSRIVEEIGVLAP